MSKIYPYAGFWKRVVAFIIDAIVLCIPVFIMSGIVMYKSMSTMLPAAMAAQGQQIPPEAISSMLNMYIGMFGLQILSLILYWLYNALMESSSKQATLGKMAMGIKVVDESGQRISFWRATGRAFGKWLSSLILYIGFLMAGATRRKQALHDIICSTLVVDEHFQPGEATPEVPTHFVLLTLSSLAVVAAFLLPFVFLGALMIADITHDTNTTPWDDKSMEQVEETFAITGKYWSAYTKFFDLKRLPAEERKTVTEDGYTYTFMEDGIHATREDDSSYELFLNNEPYNYTPCCKVLSEPSTCTKMKENIDSLKMCE